MATSTKTDPDLATGAATPPALPPPGATTPERDLDAAVEHALRHHPAFAVLTVGGRHWIDPYSGARVPVTAGHHQPAKTYLLARRPWLRAPLNRLADLEVFRWRLYLSERIGEERRLRVFSHDGRWLNPFSGELTTLVVSGGIGEPTLHEMAVILARSPLAQHGQLMDRLRLEAALASARVVGTAPARSDPPTRATTRITGPRAASGTGRTATATGLDREHARMKDSLEHMLSPLPTIPGFGIALHYEPMAGVGGDFYDCTRLDEQRWFIAVGDVSGHGLQGALVAVTALKALRFILREHDDLAQVVTLLNDELRKDLPRGQFVTLFAGILDTRRSQLTCLCAGHHPALLASRRRARVLERIGNRGPALGLMGSATLAAALRPATSTLVPGDTLFIYTDGLSEAKNEQQSEYGEHRLMGSVIANLESPYDLLVDQVVDDARRFAAGVIGDDLTVLALSVE